MKIKLTLPGAEYQSPVCTYVDFSSEGILCASFGNEDYEGNVNYGDGSDNKGWI